MFSLGDQFGREAGLLRVECKGVEVDIEPVERFPEDVLVLHLIVQLAVVIVCQIDHEAAVLFLEEIAQVAGIDKDTAILRKQFLHSFEECRHIIQATDYARTVHEHQDCVELF